MRKPLSVILILMSLFSGQLFAKANGHLFYKVQNADHVLRHSGDSDDIHSKFEDSADDLRNKNHSHAQSD
ncbi:DUF2554 family protein [Pantoea sp. LMR881]|uniref:DUF2554 family protein n=1 Tax=Pantoea sp. LMR881 TaxID=3014336 RepID=UPI0022AFF882|nr:DUF2554 family protein [Pantoea sp. LMR881]MCZ4061059.1 DUF2554 family protein [Pantoea sp. LMR881]